MENEYYTNRNPRGYQIPTSNPMTLTRYDGILDAPFFNTKVAGVSHDGRQEIIAKLDSGEKLLCLRDKFNQYDKNAVKIVLLRDTNVCLGFLNKDLAAKIGPAIDNGSRYSAVISEITGRNKSTMGVNIRVSKLSTEESSSRKG